MQEVPYIDHVTTQIHVSSIFLITYRIPPCETSNQVNDSINRPDPSITSLPSKPLLTAAEASTSLGMMLSSTTTSATSTYDRVARIIASSNHQIHDNLRTDFSEEITKLTAGPINPDALLALFHEYGLRILGGAMLNTKPKD